eukprot:5902750-Pleurochrysis_carterae.AAC.2
MRTKEQSTCALACTLPLALSNKHEHMSAGALPQILLNAACKRMHKHAQAHARASRRARY